MQPETIISTIFTFIKKHDKYINITNEYNSSQKYLKEAAQKALDIKYAHLKPQVICFPKLGIDEYKFEIFLGTFKKINNICDLVKTYGLFCVKLEKEYYIWLPFSNAWYGSNLCMNHDEEIMKKLCGFHIVQKWSQDVVVLHVNETASAKLVKIIKQNKSTSYLACFTW
jgi:hypothetical protein